MSPMPSNLRAEVVRRLAEGWARWEVVESFGEVYADEIDQIIAVRAAARGEREPSPEAKELWEEIKEETGFTEPAEAEAPPDCVMLDTITRAYVTWLWPSRIPFGKVTILEGDPERAKSVLTLDLAARVSTGTPMPSEIVKRDPAGVVIVCAEDDLADTVIPRLLAHAGDLSRIASIPLARDERGHVQPLMLPEHQDRLELAMRKVNAKLLVIDPITAYLSEMINTHNDASVRRATTPLTDLAQRTGAAIVLVRHLNKSGELKAKYRGGGSIAFTGAARAVLVVEEHPEQPGLLVLARVKNNLAKPTPSIGYRIASEELYECPRIVWQGIVHIDADTLLRSHDSRRDAEAREEAEELLRDLLGDGPAPVAEAKKLLAGAGISDSTIKRAKKRLRIASVRERDENGKTIGWTWRLPADDDDPPEGHQGVTMNPDPLGSPGARGSQMATVPSEPLAAGVQVSLEVEP
jgi:AAA domain